MTNEYLIKKEMIELNEKIEIHYDKENERIKIDLNKDPIKNEFYFRKFYIYIKILFI